MQVSRKYLRQPGTVGPKRDKSTRTGRTGRIRKICPRQSGSKWDIWAAGTRRTRNGLFGRNGKLQR
ncbi:hypothetical protein KI387_005336, partial [Taxus chinensis]